MNTKILEIADFIKSKNYRVFIAEAGTYGIYTNKDGLKVVYFQLSLNSSNIEVSGCYKTDKRKNGTGWLITDSFNNNDIDAYIRALAPTWAVGNSKVHYTTLTEYMKVYACSSKYHEH